MLLVYARQIARHVFQRDDRNIERVAEADEARSLVGTVAIQHTCQNHRLVGYEADRFASHAAETNHDVGGPHLLYFKEIRIVDDALNHVADVIRLFRVCRHHLLDVQHRRGLFRLDHLRPFVVVPRDEADEAFHLLEAFLLTGRIEMGVTRRLGMNASAAEVFHRNVFAQYGLDDVRPCDEHLRDVLDHKHEIGQRRRINGATCTRPQNQRDLRNYARGYRVAVKNFSITGQGTDTFLNTCATGIVDSDDRALHFQGVVHDFGNLAGMLQAQRATCHRKVLCIDAHGGSENRPCTCHNAITGQIFFIHAEITPVVLHEQVILMERILIQQR